ncbi:MAG TPA: hypothetical protein VGE02_04105 [Gemmatimonadales bacterium]
MLTLPDAIASFDAASAAGTIPDRKTGRRGPLKPSRRDPILSNVRKALEHALEALHGDRAISHSVLASTDLTPLLLTLPSHGRLAAEAEQMDAKAASKIESNVRLFVSVVLGRDVVKDRQPVERQRVLPAYQALYDALDAFVEADGGAHRDKRRSLRRGFVRWVELATANGAATPVDVPDDYATVMGWGERLGWSMKDTAYALNAWRRAVRLAAAPYAMAWDLVVRNGIGIKSLPDFTTRARALGFKGDLATATAADLLAVFAPKLTRALEWVISQGINHGLSRSWASDMRDMASWVVAGLIQLGEDPAAYTWYDLWTVRRPVEVMADVEQDDQLAQYGIDGGTTIAQHSLMRRLLDSTARRSYELSHLRLFNSDQERDAVPVYTSSLLGNMEMAWVATDRFFRQRMHQQRPELWAQARVEYDELTGHTEAYNTTRILMGRKAKGKLAITWPQLVCMGLPWLARQCYALRREVADRLSRIGHLESRESHALVNRYCASLTEYAIVALLTDDCLRVKNYAGAMAGEHVRVEASRSADGRWRGAEQLRTSFTALDDDSVALKSKKVSDGMPNQRLDRRVTPGIVDHVLWFEYWTIARPRALVAAGLLHSVEAFDPANDRFAVFVTPRPSAEQREAYHRAMSEWRTSCEAGGDATLPAWRGNLSEDMLSDAFGAALHRICVEVLGRELPPWGSDELTSNFRGLFAGHIVRLMAATYLGGVRGNWQEATYRTNDAEVTLSRHYVHLSAWAKEREHLETPEGLHWFDKVMDRVMKLRSSDDARWPQFWHHFDPRRPDAALAWLDRVEVPTSRTRRAGRRATVRT